MNQRLLPGSPEAEKLYTNSLVFRRVSTKMHMELPTKNSARNETSIYLEPKYPQRTVLIENNLVLEGTTSTPKIEDKQVPGIKIIWTQIFHSFWAFHIRGVHQGHELVGVKCACNVFSKSSPQALSSNFSFMPGSKNGTQWKIVTWWRLLYVQ